MTQGDSDAAVHRQLGELNAVTRGLQESLRRIEDMMQRSEDKSDESRSKVHKRMDELVDRVSTVEGSVGKVQSDIKEMKPTVDEVKRWKLIGVGALGMIGIGGIALGVSFADAIKRIAGVLIGRL